jgi:hypothetical protein
MAVGWRIAVSFASANRCEAAAVFNPKGIVSSSQGLRGTSYPGLWDGIPLGFPDSASAWRRQVELLRDADQLSTFNRA